MSYCHLNYFTYVDDILFKVYLVFLNWNATQRKTNEIGMRKQNWDVLNQSDLFIIFFRFLKKILNKYSKIILAVVTLLQLSGATHHQCACISKEGESCKAIKVKQYFSCVLRYIELWK